MSSPKRPKATPVSSRTSGMGNSKVERALALERVYRQIDKAELNYVGKLTELHECMADSCGNRGGLVTGENWRQKRKGDIRGLVTGGRGWQERKGDTRGLVTPEILWNEKNVDTRSAPPEKC